MYIYLKIYNSLHQYPKTVAWKGSTQTSSAEDPYCRAVAHCLITIELCSTHHIFNRFIETCGNLMLPRTLGSRFIYYIFSICFFTKLLFEVLWSPECVSSLVLREGFHIFKVQHPWYLSISLGLQFNGSTHMVPCLWCYHEGVSTLIDCRWIFRWESSPLSNLEDTHNSALDVTILHFFDFQIFISTISTFHIFNFLFLHFLIFNFSLLQF